MIVTNGFGIKCDCVVNEKWFNYVVKKVLFLDIEKQMNLRVIGGNELCCVEMDSVELINLLGF